MDYQALLRQKDAELDERATLLLKTKLAIEQLQEELGTARRQNEAYKREAEQAVGQLRDAEEHLHLVEGELECKTKECTELLSEGLGLKRRLQELQDGLSSSKDSHAASIISLQAQLRDNEKALTAARSEAQQAQQTISALQASARERDGTLADTTARLEAAETANAQLRAGLQHLSSEHAAVQQAQRAAENELTQTRARAAEDASALGSRLAAEMAARERAETQLAAAQEALAEARARGPAEAKAWDRRLQALQEDWAARLAACESGWAAKCDKLRVEGEAALEESKKEWTRKYYLTEGEWFKKLQAANQDWAFKLEGVGREWMQRYDADRAKWEEERAALQRGMEERLRAAEAAHATALEEAKAHHKRKAAAAEARVAADLRMLERAWSQRVEAASAAAEQEVAAARRSWEAAAAEREALTQRELADARQAAQAAVAEAQAAGAARLAEAEKCWLEEKHALERQWTERTQASEKAASEAQAVLRAQIEARVAAVMQRVSEMARREAKREAKRSELLRQVAELRAVSEDEHRRRGELESALREASAIFKRELADKNEQLDLLRRELRCLRSCERSYEPRQLGYDLVEVPVARISRSATRLAHCLGRPASAGAAATCGRPLSPIFVGPNTFVGEDMVSPRVLSPVRPSSAAAKAARAAEKEAAALRAARKGYQSALLEQQEERTALLRSINEALKEEVPVAPPAASRPRKRWNLSVATRLHDLVQSTPSSPIGAIHSPRYHHLRPKSAAAGQTAEEGATAAAAAPLAASPLPASPRRYIIEATVQGGDELMQPQQFWEPHRSFSASADGPAGVVDGPGPQAQVQPQLQSSPGVQPQGCPPGSYSPATSTCRSGRESAQEFRDLRRWHDELASRVGQAVSRLQQLSNESEG